MAESQLTPPALAELTSPLVGEAPTPVEAYSYAELIHRKVDSSHIRTILYIHVPKTGGHSVNALLRQNGYEQIDLHETNDFFYWTSEERWLERYRQRRPAPRYFMTGHFRLDHSIFRRMPFRYTTITILRHPMEQILSHYNFTLRHSQAPFHDEVVSGRLSFLDYAAKMFDAIGPQFRFFDQTGNGTVAPTGMATVQQCLDNLFNKVSFYGFTERFNEFSILLGYLIGCSNVLSLVPVNVTQQADDLHGIRLKQSLSSEERAQLSKLLAEDIWFYDEALREYDLRLRDPSALSALNSALPLAEICANANRQLLEIRELNNSSRHAFGRLK